MRPVTMTSAFGHPEDSKVQRANGSISRGPLFKPYDWLKLTLLAICIDIATL
jgi:hypothetical protein